MRLKWGKNQYRIILTLFISHLIFLCTGISVSASASILPEDFAIKEQFQPGYGAPVGKMLLIQGDVYVTHSRIRSVFPAKDNIPLFRGDTIYAEQKGRVRFSLNDGSIMTLASSTKLIINSSVYHPEQKTRSTFLSMDFGKARFYVTKLLAYKESTFKVKTSTSVAGVRGSDFIITATLQRTEVITLENTKLEIIGLAAPELKPVMLSDFQKTSIRVNGRVEVPVNIPVNEINILKRGFTLPGDSAGMPDARRGPVGSEPKSSGGEKIIDSKEEAILVPEDALVIPDFQGENIENELGPELIELNDDTLENTMDPEGPGDIIFDEGPPEGPPELPGMPSSP